MVLQSPAGHLSPSLHCTERGRTLLIHIPSRCVLQVYVLAENAPHELPSSPWTGLWRVCRLAPAILRPSGEEICPACHPPHPDTARIPQSTGVEKRKMLHLQRERAALSAQGQEGESHIHALKLVMALVHTTFVQLCSSCKRAKGLLLHS